MPEGNIDRPFTLHYNIARAFTPTLQHCPPFHTTLQHCHLYANITTLPALSRPHYNIARPACSTVVTIGTYRAGQLRFTCAHDLYIHNCPIMVIYLQISINNKYIICSPLLVKSWMALIDYNLETRGGPDQDVLMRGGAVNRQRLCAVIYSTIRGRLGPRFK